MIPSLRQFSKWSLPSKVTYIAFVLAVVSGAFAVFAYFTPLNNSTSLVSFVPEVPDQSRSGNCTENSRFSNRATSLRCFTPDNSVGWDPCFELAIGSTSFGTRESTTVVCGATPWGSSDSFVMIETEPRIKSSAVRSLHGSFEEDGIWAVEIKVGWSTEYCQFIGGATTVIFGERANYLCDDNESFFLVGYPRSGATWTIRGVVFGEDGRIVSDTYYDIKKAYN